MRPRPGEAGVSSSYFYSEGSYDPRDPSKGLFRSPFLIRVARHIWTTPTTAFDDSGKVPKNCKARAHAQLTWEGEMTGYICGQARTMISTSDWTSKDGAYNYEHMFKSVIKLFEKKDDAWVTDTLAFYQRVFGSLDGSGDDESDISAILALRTSRNTPASDIRYGSPINNLSLHKLNLYPVRCLVSMWDHAHEFSGRFDPLHHSILFSVSHCTKVAHTVIAVLSDDVTSQMFMYSLRLTSNVLRLT
ncbi:hypothetical protein C8F04DRAFT_1398203 [Mycena alexandri]|uniref:Uncharacterized protein n=1 Tax=Mycena alexandri TaxID=1745969 RepID=A0AAD6SLU3_9AGAR|nr:hypothetical protein C8F04DRAFT_1398203 [Mycena alexandri]